MKRVFAPAPNYFGGSMKKISAVLLVLALVGSAVFASFTGNAGVSFGVDLDEKEYGFTNTVELSAELNFFEKLVDKAGEGDIYAEINAELTLGLEFDKEDSEFDASTGIGGNVEITSAKIIGDNWYVGILGALGAPNFAATAIELNDDGDSELDLTFGLDKPAGVAVGFSDFEFGLGFFGSYDDPAAYDLYVSAVTPEFEFADGLTGQFGLAGLLADDAMGVFGSVKVGFAQDDLSVSLASDIQYIKDGSFDAEVALAASYDFLTLDVYYATSEFPLLDDNDDPIDVYPGAENILSVQLGAVIEGFDITVTGKDLVNTTDLSAEVAYALSDELTVSVKGGYSLGTEVWFAGGGVEYAADMFTAKLDGSYYSTKQLKLSASVESDKLVDGATLSLGYAADDVLGNVSGDLDNGHLGAITAKAVIAF